MPLIFTVVMAGLLAGFSLWAKRRRQQLLHTIEVVVLKDVASSRLGNQRDITVFLPPRYRETETDRFDVLYVNDGQECETLGIREALARLTSAGRIKPIIVVAVPTNENRLHEYGTAVAMNTLGLGMLAPAYTHFIVEELMPQIDNSFRTRPGAGFVGVSLGGLSAFDIAWNHPQRFALVGVMSGSFWWRASSDEEHIDAGRRIAHSLARQAARPTHLRLWFQTGTRDEVSDRDGDGVIDAVQDTQELMSELLATGVKPEQMQYVEVTGGRHDYETWARVLPAFLEWAFRPGQARQT